MTLQKRHYQLFALALSQIANEKKREELINFLYPIFINDNEHFDIEKFREFIKRKIKGESLKGLNCNPKYL